ncbi:ParB/RepB/Spo0J family partition protein [Methylovorus menthalis]|uniref:ParB/RepB/Spo0J family partition protein n=1 Tax=Methylovorus menthalis TaxID=1002227 RepID=UPI001E312A06|nr:ParB/RepB/Spo0J family partition protein [Methylovorus menthalis]MCB4811673.1 ParB/RepB/Spo0J family partition protein [Methylovorus menthalis]
MTHQDQVTSIFVPTSSLLASPTNPRKRFDEEKIQGMADTMATVGVLQPLVVRNFKGKKGKYEIVAGETRWRAATVAGLDQVPVIVRELTDQQVIKIQVIENLQRTDLHPLEEAEGFKLLLDKSQDLVPYTVQELAKEIGKSPRTIFASMQLCNLCDAAKKVFYEGFLSASTALLIARIPGELLQKKAISELKKDIRPGEALSYRRAQDLLKTRFTLQLSKAPFDINDPNLVKSAGTCTECPKRTGNCREAYPDIESADVCTDPDCHSNKRGNHVLHLKKEGARIIEGEAAKKILPYSSNYIDGGYIEYDQNMHRGKCSGNRLDELLADDPPELLTVIHPVSGDIVRVYKENEAMQKLAAKGLIDTVLASGKSSAEKQREADAKLDRAYRAGYLEAVRAEFDTKNGNGFSYFETRMIATVFFNRLDFEDRKSVIKVWWPERATGTMHDAVSDFSRSIPDFSLDDLELLLIDCALVSELRCDSYNFDRYPPERLLAFIKHYEIDIDHIKDAVDLRIWEEKSRKKTNLPRPTPRSAAQAQESKAPENQEALVAELAGDLSPEEAALIEPAAQADETSAAQAPKNKFEEIKAKKLAKIHKKESAKADESNGTAAAAAA